MRNYVIAALLLALAGCSTVPSGGPTNSELLAQDDQSKAPFAFELFDITSDVARVAGAPVDDSFAGRFGGRGVGAGVIIGRGDTLSVTIFEAANGGLFSSNVDTATGSAGAKNVTLPQVLVDSGGYIHVPYADEILAAGKTPRQVEAAIEDKLKGRAIEPQAIVSLAANRSALVTVSGEVKQPQQVPVQSANMRVLDAIADAGGTELRPYEGTVTIVRGDKRATASLKTIFTDPRENVFVHGGDTVLVQRRLRTITVLGAERVNAQVPFANDTMTLAEALGLSNGLDDQRATEGGVYVFRTEPASLIRRMRPGWQDTEGGERIPTLYRLDMRVAQGYFLAQQFQMRDHDLLFIANADGTQYLKVLQLIGAGFGIYNTIATGPAVTAATK